MAKAPNNAAILPPGFKPVVLSPAAVAALVRFFVEASHAGVGDGDGAGWDDIQGLEPSVIKLAESLNIDPTVDVDTLEMAIRHALTQETK